MSAHQEQWEWTNPGFHSKLTIQLQPPFISLDHSLSKVFPVVGMEKVVFTHFSKPQQPLQSFPHFHQRGDNNFYLQRRHISNLLRLVSCLRHPHQNPPSVPIARTRLVMGVEVERKKWRRRAQKWIFIHLLVLMKMFMNQLLNSYSSASNGQGVFRVLEV